MAWVDDVYTDETIYSTQWGNVIRDRVHHLFATVAEMKAVNVKPVVGMLAYVTATSTEYRWDGTGWLIVDEPWQAHAMRMVAGAVAWSVGASGSGLANLRLSPQSQSRFRRRNGRTVELATGVVFQDGYPVGQPTATLVLELPVVCDNGSMSNLNAGSAAVQVHSQGGIFVNGSGFAQGNNVWSTGGPAAHQDGSTDFPVPADMWTVRLSYPTAAQYA